MLCNKLSKRVDRFGYRAIGVGADKETNGVVVQLNKGTMARLSSKTALEQMMMISWRVFLMNLMD
ncbi:hypothetical protein [Helicobacter pylori]|uniref:hypothetical protein n=1 Tax=Helicobacter pylori TaxID=210 RepID=UPI001E54F597|nr:hypothetical protein [Helicobacter pylori]